MKTIILDTNFLMIPYKYHIDILSEIERLVPEAHRIATLGGVVNELRGIRAKRPGKGSIASGIALQLVEKGNIGIIEPTDKYKKVDESIINFALSNSNAIICTNDRELKKKLKEKNVPVICMRGKSRLDFC